MMYNPNDNTTFKINRHKTPEELEKKMKQIQEMTATPEEEKQLEEDIRNGKIPGFINENGKPHVMRWLKYNNPYITMLKYTHTTIY